MGSSSGTVEFLAPTVVDITSPSVIRTDYEGQIDSSAAGLTQQYTQAIIDATSGLVTQQAFGNYVQSATENMARLETKIPDSNLLDCADGSGWMGYMGNAVTIDVSIQEVSGGNDYVSSAVYLKSGVDYVFSVYSSLQPAIYLGDCDGDPTHTGEDIGEYDGWDEKTVNTGSGTYKNCNRYYTTFRPSSDGYYKIELYNNSNFSFYRSQLEVGTTPTAWQAGAKNYSSEIKQTSTSISLSVKSDIEGKLLDTGINIENGEIDIKADKFTVMNNDNEQVLGLDANGDFEVSGTIKATNLYRSLCILSGYYNTISGRTVIYYSTEWYYCKSREDDRTIEGGYEIGKYYEDNSSRGLWSNSDFSRNTYSADIVLITNNGAADWPSSGIVMIPRAQDFPGKVIEFRNYGNNSATIQIVSGYFVTFHLDNQGNIVVSGYTSNSQTLVAGATMTLYSFKNGNTYYWMRIS
jgi:hypothetical protein